MKVTELQASDLDGGDTSPILLRWLVGLRWAVFLLLAATLPLGERFLDFHVRYAIALPVMAIVVIFNVAMQRRLSRRRGAPRHAARGRARRRGRSGRHRRAARRLGRRGQPAQRRLLRPRRAGGVAPAGAHHLRPRRPRRVPLRRALRAARRAPAAPATPPTARSPRTSTACGRRSSSPRGWWPTSSRACAAPSTSAGARSPGCGAARRRSTRFAALGTLAAGTAHELATPLGTIAVLAGEIDGAPARRGRRPRRADRRAGGALPRHPHAHAGRRGRAARRRRAPRSAPAVDAAVEAWRRAHPGAAVTLATALPEGATVPLSAGEIEAALGALLDNALHAHGAA